MCRSAEESGACAAMQQALKHLTYQRFSVIMHSQSKFSKPLVLRALAAYGSLAGADLVTDCAPEVDAGNGAAFRV